MHKKTCQSGGLTGMVVTADVRGYQMVEASIP